MIQDEVLADGKVVIDLIDAIKPGSINYDLVLPGGNEEVRFIILLTKQNNIHIFLTRLYSC